METGGLEVRKRPRAAAEQRRRQVDQELVREPGGKQRAGQAGAAFDEQFVDLPRGEKLERSAEIDASGCRRDRRDLGTRGAQCFGARGTSSVRDAELPRPAAQGSGRSAASCRRESSTTRSGWRAAPGEPDIEPGIVRKHRAAAGHHGRRAGTQALHILARSLAGDPAAFATRKCGATVEARGELDDDPWPAASHARNESRIQVAAFPLHHPTRNYHAGRCELLDAFTADTRVRIPHCVDHARNAGRYERLRARRRAAVVTAGFERHEGGRSTHVDARRAERLRVPRAPRPRARASPRRSPARRRR